ncbi:Hypothetical protein CINCED_3A016587 [Cinara cedri]|uniref:EF-hand domain-containing protein n=1 Tax=Cinara cedri TaxID=506608 RepID=A0A5E4NCH6_9HEMI|nr:Hypothetical protein CINCED_3A016587 [Cinara cedri]
MFNGMLNSTWGFRPKIAHCQEAHQSGYLKRATTEQLLEVFNKYTTVEKQGERYINSVDFIKNYIGILNEPSSDLDSLWLLSGIVDTNKDGLISFAEFQAFESLLSEPDALYKVAFHLFDINGNGVISYDEFVSVIKKTELYLLIPFNLDSQFMKLYFGEKKNRIINYSEFAQFLHDFHEECGTEIFRTFDKSGSGFISANDFQEIMLLSKSHLLTTGVRDNLLPAAGAHRVSFPYFMAFISLLNNMELIKRIYLNASNENRNREVTKDEFLYSTQVMSQITPLEVDILFTLCHLLHQRAGKIVYNDLNSITPEQYYKEIHNRRIAEFHAVSSPSDRGVFIQVLESVYRFMLGSVSGAIGATAVYPIDLVKTRIQNQRAGSFIGELMYRNSFDCFKKVIRHEGIFGLYRGLLPQLIGVAPEKAAKLTVNDLVRDKLRKENGDLTVSAEIVAGACAGFSQVIFTNPLEIVKIRLQVAGEIASTRKLSAITVIKELGFFGMYKGAKACFLRDIPFSAIYFPAYNHVKQAFADEKGYNHPLTLLAAGCIAGVPAASLVTPADVIKTRLQVVARKGQTSYKGLVDCASKIYNEEGPRAFWKGTGARVFRSSPQFGVTLLSYEILQRLFYVDFGGSRPSGSEKLVSVHGAGDGITPSNPDHIGGYHAVLPILEGIESKFGLVFPKVKSEK